MTSKVNLEEDSRTLNQCAFDQVNEAVKPYKRSISSQTALSVKSSCRPDRLFQRLKGFFPILYWLRHYDVKKDFMADLFCGLTIAIFQVPQGMGYAMLAKVPPVYGLYSSFFPVLIYALMGTSRQAAVGTFSLTSLMTGAIVLKWADFSKGIDHTESLNGTFITDEMHIHDNVGHERLNLSPIQVATVVALLCGIYQAAFGLFRLGYLAVYLSEHLVSGFTTGAAMHVATSQVANLFGMGDLPSHHGAMNLVYTYVDFFRMISHVHLVTLAITGTSVIILILFKQVINPWVAKYCRVPIPIELLLVIAGTVASHCIHLHSEHGVNIVGRIHTGLPSPVVPACSALATLVAESLAVAVVGFSSTISLGKIFGQRYGYEINANQELFALGSCNLFGCFFSCIPAAASISRSSVQDGAGGKTQLVSLINCVGLLVVLLWLGSLLEPLPNCILGSIIVVSLKGMIFQVQHFWRYWKVSKVDGLIWMVTFLSVILIDVDIGLLVGVVFSLTTLVIRSQRPKVFVLGRVSDTDVYVPLDRYAKATEHPGVKVFRFGGPLHFGNVEYFSKALEKVTGISTSLGATNKKKRSVSRESTLSFKTVEKHQSDVRCVRVMALREDNVLSEKVKESCISESNGRSVSVDYSQHDDLVRHVVLDCSSFGFVDNSGVVVLKRIFETFNKNNVRFSLAACPPTVLRTLHKGGFFEMVTQDDVFPTIQNAISRAASAKAPVIANGHSH